MCTLCSIAYYANAIWSESKHTQEQNATHRNRMINGYILLKTRIVPMSLIYLSVIYCQAEFSTQALLIPCQCYLQNKNIKFVSTTYGWCKMHHRNILNRTQKSHIEHSQLLTQKYVQGVLGLRRSRLATFRGYDARNHLLELCRLRRKYERRG